MIENKNGPSRRAVVASAAVLAAGLVMGTSAEAGTAPTVKPVPGTPKLSIADYDLGELGFVVEEFFITGEATAYRAEGSAGSDGMWNTVEDRKAGFTTRVVVVRPKDAKHFNGTAVVEWLNVSSLQDAAPDWIWPHREYLRGGYVWVGVSAQRLGIHAPSGEAHISLQIPSNALKLKNPQRYAELNHPGDAFSYDIYTQSARLVRSGALTQELKPTRTIAAGQSQSAGRMAAYANGVHHHARVFDGFLIHSRGGGRALDMVAESGSPYSSFSSPLQIRADLKVPVMQLITETDIASFYLSRQPDSEFLRTWEVAGTAHADTYALSPANRIDDGRTPPVIWGHAMAATDSIAGLKAEYPINANPAHKYAAIAAVRHLDRWIAGRGRPPRGALLEIRPPTGGGFLDSSHLAVDSHGIALGGIRNPWVDVPVARFAGLGNRGSPFARLAGVTELFPKTRIATMYPGGKADYLAKFKVALDAVVSAGFMLADDATEALVLAGDTWPG